MTSVSHVVKKIIESRPNLQESLIEGIINFANLAENLQSRIEREVDKKVKIQTIIMALRRHAEKIQYKNINLKQVRLTSEIIMRTNICDITLIKTPSAIKKINEIYKIIDYEKGETLNVIYGNYETTIVISQKHLENIKKILNEEKILNIKNNLVSLTLSLTKDFLTTPGVLAFTTRKLAIENINIFENISTMTELIFIISEKDAVRAYNIFQDILIEK